MKTVRTITALCGVLLAGCSENLSLSGEDLVVVQAYLYAGQPVEEIRVASTVPLDVDTTEAPAVSDAAVTLIKDGQRYTLAPTTDRPGYYHYDGSDLTVAPGDQFGLEVGYFGKVATAETTVPLPPEGVTISAEELTLPDLSTDGFGGFDRDALQLTVSWGNDEGNLYYLVVENVETDPQEIERGTFPGGEAPPGDFVRRFITQPTNGNTYSVNGMSFSYLGRHRVTVYRVNQEYADLYLGREQDSRELNEPLTNIHKGLGVFSAFNSDSVFFTLVQE